MITIVDYGMGNLRSVQKAFESQGAQARIASTPGQIERATRIVLPGVGAFTAAMKQLTRLKLVGPLKEKIASGTPYLGLCLGLQLLFSRSEEGGRVRGLGILPGEVKRFRGKLKIPHMGWNSISIQKKDSPILKGIRSGEHFYFVHSYYAVPEDRTSVLAVTGYGRSFCSAVWKDNIFATQFHPEKSQGAGLKIIRNFIEARSL